MSGNSNSNVILVVLSKLDQIMSMEMMVLCKWFDFINHVTSYFCFFSHNKCYQWQSDICLNINLIFCVTSTRRERSDIQNMPSVPTFNQWNVWEYIVYITLTWCLFLCLLLGIPQTNNMAFFVKDRQFCKIFHPQVK